MSDNIEQRDRRLYAAQVQREPQGPSAMLLGVTCVLLGVGCLAVTFLNGDLAVQSGAVLLGVSLGASGVIAFLAGDR